MKLNILDMTKKKIGEIELPNHFDEPLREDIIKRSVLSMNSKKRNSYGANTRAGKRASAKLSRRRRAYRGSYGYGISRVPRKIMSRMGRRMNWQAAVAPGTVGGRKAHPPKSSKKFIKKLNKKESKKALRSAIAATINKEIVSKRGHLIPEDYPFIIEEKFEDLDKTKSVMDILNKLGFKEELERTSRKKIRPGKGTMRGRKYRRKKGPLIIVSKDSKISKAAKNIPGVEVIDWKKLNINILAPGAIPGRASIWTKNAIENLKKENLFM